MANVMISSTVSAENTLLFLQYCTVYCMFLDIPDTRKTGFSVRMFGRLVYNIFILNKCIVMYRKLHSGCFFPTHCRIHLPVFISCTVLYIAVSIFLSSYPVLYCTFIFSSSEEIASKKLFYNTSCTIQKYLLWPVTEMFFKFSFFFVT